MLSARLKAASTVTLQVTISTVLGRYTQAEEPDAPSVKFHEIAD
jgi:hypothetical protein